MKNFCCAIAILAIVFPANSDAATATLTRGVPESVFYPGGYTGTADNTIYYYSPSSTHGRLSRNLDALERRVEQPNEVDQWSDKRTCAVTV